MNDAIKMMESKMSPDAVLRSRIMAEQEILAIRLNKLKEKIDGNQTGFHSINVKSISRNERQTDMKISTLIEYLDSLGLGLEIKIFPKNNTMFFEEEILLRM